MAGRGEGERGSEGREERRGRRRKRRKRRKREGRDGKMKCFQTTHKAEVRQHNSLLPRGRTLSYT